MYSIYDIIIIYYPLKFVENNFFFYTISHHHVARAYYIYTSIYIIARVYTFLLVHVIGTEWTKRRNDIILYNWSVSTMLCMCLWPRRHCAKPVCLVARNCNIILLLLCLLCPTKWRMYTQPEVFVRPPPDELFVRPTAASQIDGRYGWYIYALCNADCRRRTSHVPNCSSTKTRHRTRSEVIERKLPQLLTGSRALPGT